MFFQTITIIRPGEKTDRTGNTSPDWEDPASETDVPQVSVQPVVGSETISDDRDAVTEGWTLYTRPGVDIDLKATDRVVHGETTFQVVGDVRRWPHPLRPGVHHVEATLQRVVGG